MLNDALIKALRTSVNFSNERSAKCEIKMNINTKDNEVNSPQPGCASVGLDVILITPLSLS